VLARKLYRGYTSSRAHYRALHDPEGRNEWSHIVPKGSPWSGPIHEESSANIGIPARKPRTAKSGTEPVQPMQESSANVGVSNKQGRKKKGGKAVDAAEDTKDFKGDRVLAQSISLMKDIMWSRECAHAVAEGDAGRVYEVLKANNPSVAFVPAFGIPHELRARV